VHWILSTFRSSRHCPRSMTQDPPEAAPAMLQGKNTWGTVGYRAPASQGHGSTLSLQAVMRLIHIEGRSGIEKHELLEILSGTSFPRRARGTYRAIDGDAIMSDATPRRIFSDSNRSEAVGAPPDDNHPETGLIPTPTSSSPSPDRHLISIESSHKDKRGERSSRVLCQSPDHRPGRCRIIPRRPRL